MIAKYLQVGADVYVWMAPFWTPGKVVERNANDVVILVGGRRVNVHRSVIRRDVRRAPRYYIQTGRRRRYFDSADAAQRVASDIFERTGCIVGISVAQ